MKDIHLLVREIKDGYEQLGLAYTKDDIVNTLIRYYGLKPYQIEDLKL
jgi:transcriptional regulator of nitric oxide reductase